MPVFPTKIGETNFFWGIAHTIAAPMPEGISEMNDGPASGEQSWRGNRSSTLKVMYPGRKPVLVLAMRLVTRLRKRRSLEHTRT